MVERSAVAAHYTLGGLGDSLLGVLQELGKDLDNLTPEDLAPVDEFHIRGREASAELAALAGIGASDRVLDVGSGLGGPARHLAGAYGCHVTGIDLTAEFCEVATMLGQRTGLADRLAFEVGDALAMPFRDASFDVAWTQHVAMNIADRASLYAEIFRVVKPGGRLAVYDILQGPGGEVLFPVPWASRPELSHLVRPEEMRQLLEAAGFHIAEWRDVSEPGREWFAAIAERARAHGLPPLGIHLLFGEERPAMVANQVRNLTEGRIELLQVVAERPA